MKKLIVSALLMFLVSPLSAQDSEVSDELERKLGELLIESGSLSLGEQMAELFVAQMSQAIRQSRPDLPPVAFDIIREETISIINEELDRGSFQSMLIPIYAQFYTIDEVDELLAFYRSPIGKKTVNILPELTQESSQAGERWGMLIGPTIGARISTRLAEEGIELD